MNINKWNSKALSLCLMVAVFATYSMSALASPPKIAGEILVSGKTLGDRTSVNVNGSNVENGSSIFSSSTIKTPENSDAIINLGLAGKIKLAPSTNFELSFDEKSLSGNLSAGKVVLMSSASNMESTFSVKNAGQFKFAPNTSATLSITPEGLVVELKAGQVTSLNSTGNVNVKTSKGNVKALTTGETVTAQDDDDKDEGFGSWAIWALIFGGAAAGIIIAATSDNNRVALGGGGTVVSPSQ